MRTLRRAIETDRVAHAYLFSGPRGTGKTSTAKALAMGLNCAAGPTAEPDGTCESCRAIVGNSSLDVVEMDAASNRGIDEIRDLRDRVNLAPVSGRTKVYVIDEVHMLTAEAFNALLKMLEEPPEHVVFVLATTEKHKVLATIISRCQAFDFRRPGVEILAKKLAEIADAEGIEAEPEALTIVARAGGGSFRDAEGLLDQLSSFAEGRITAAMARELLGSAGPGTLYETVYALHEGRAADALRIVDGLSGEGRDLGQFVGELLGHLRNLMLLPHAPEVALAEVGAEERAPLEEQAASVPTAGTVRLIEALGDASGRIKRGGDPKLELELSFLKIARGYTEPSVEALLGRLEALEKAVENGVPADTNPADTNPAAAAAAAADDDVPRPAPRQDARREQGAAEELDPEEASSPEHVPVDNADDAPEGTDPDEARGTEPGGGDPSGGAAGGPGSGSGADLAAEWGSVVGELKRRRQALTAAVYGEARVEGMDGGVLRLVFPEDQSFFVGIAKDRKHLDELGRVLQERFGSQPRVEVRAAGGEPAGEPTGETAGERGGDAPEPGGPPASPARPAPERSASTRYEPPVEDAPPPEEELAPAHPQDEPPPGPRSDPPSDTRAGARTATRLGGGAVPQPGVTGGDGRIRGEAEVFEVARELGLFDGGS